MTAISAALEKKLVSLRRDSASDWERTLRKAPHKPFLLLAVLDLVEVGVVRENLVRYDEELRWRRTAARREPGAPR